MSHASRGWTLRACWLEGLRNLRSGGVRTTLLVMAVSLLLGAATFLDGKAIADVAERARDYRNQGGYVLITWARLTADEAATTLDAAACQTLNSSPGVVAAGAVSALGRDSLVGAPGALLSIVETTPEGFRAFTGVRPFGYSSTSDAEQFLAVSELVSVEHNLQVGRTLETTGSVAGVVANVVVPRSRSAARSILAFTEPVGKAEACWIESAPASFGAWMDSAPATFDTADTFVYSQRLVDAGPSFTRYDPSRDLRNRATRPLPFVLGAIGALTVSLGLWTRRSVVGMYRAMSLPWQSVIWIQAGEVFTSVWLAFVLAFSWSTLGLALAAEPTWPVVWFALRSASWALAVCGAGSFVGIILLTRGAVMDQLKDR